MQRKSLTQFVFFTFLFFLGVQTTVMSQISVVPPSCYPGVTPAEQDAMGNATNGEAPFATWKGAYDYAVANGINTIDFAPGTYYPGGASGTSDRWGDANGGFDLVNSMTVNGNGAIIDNTGNNNSIAFATIASAASLIGFTFVEYTGNSAGAVRVNANASGWTISDCNFNGCDWAGDALSILGGSGTITGCNFYNHTRSTGSALTITTGAITISNSTFSCNSRIVAGGAVRVLGGTVDFSACTFDGNYTNSASGGALSVEGGSVSLDMTKFTCNTANVNTQDDGGAVHFIGGNLYITGCTFQGNVAKDRGGAIHASGVGVLDISSTTFSGNSVNTGSTSKGGAIFMNDVADNDISGSFFQNNSATGEGGGIYIAAGSGGNYDFMSNKFMSNSAGGNVCTGIDVFTERHITGSNNDLEYLADGHHLSNSPGSLQFTDLAIGGTTLQGNPAYSSDVVTMTSGLPLYWTTTMYTTGLNSAARMAYVLSGSNANLAEGNGLALVFRRYSSTDCDLEFVSYSGGVDGTLTPIATLVNTAAVSGSFAVKAIYNNGNWTFNVTSSGTSSELTQDPRGFRYCNSVISSSAALAGNNVGFFWQHSSTISSVYAQFGDSYFRAGDETSVNLTSFGSGLAATCASCLSNPSVTPNCPVLTLGSIQGDVFLDANLNGVNNSGEALVNVTVELLDNFGNVIATTTTDANGHYIFTGLPTGAYQVRFGVPAGYSQATSTSQNMGATSADSDIAPNATASSFLSPVINLNTSTGMSNGLDQFNNAANYVNVGAGYQSIVLPVKWADFTIKTEECQNTLSWTTESEINNDYFVIEKSADGKAFYAIGKIKGNGNRNTASEYEFVDDKNIHNAAYYKIKQVDFDGRYAYSPIVKSLPTTCQKSTQVNVFPNPTTSDVLNITIEGIDFNSSLTINIYNQIGELVTQKSFSPSELGSTLTLNTENIPSGYYNVSISQAGGSPIFQKIKFIKI